MKETSVDIGKVYALRSETGGEVTDENGKLLETLEPNVQLRTMAQEPKWLVPDDCKVTKGNFKRALAALFLLGEGNTLPAGYTRLEYLEATGSQRVKINGQFNKHIGLRLEAESFEGAGNVSCVSFSSQNPSAEGYWWVFPPRANVQNSSQWEWYWFKSSGSFKGIELATRYVASINYRGEKTATIEQNGTVAAKELPEPLEYSSTELNIVNSGWKGRCYSVKVSRNTALENNFIPCLDYTGTPCMYDTVSRTAFPNDGAGQFIVGMTLSQVRGLRLPAGGGELTLSLPYEASVDQKAQEALEAAMLNGWTLTVQYREGELPAGWHREVSFLEATGTQYIDTGVKLSNESEVRCEYMLTSAKGQNEYLFGAKDDSANFSFLCNSQVYPDDAVAYASNSSNYNAMILRGANSKTWVKHSLTIAIKGATLDGVNSYNPNSTHVFEAKNTARLFGALGFAAKARVYAFSVSRAGTPQRNLQPCIDAEGVPCMWDSVQKKAFYNAGSGQFIVGLETVEDVRAFLLPPFGGELTLSLPHEASIDKLAQAALERARANGWVLTLQYAEAEVPAGYRRLEFLESTGTQYIIANFENSKSAEYEGVVSVPALESVKYFGFNSSGDFLVTKGNFWRLQHTIEVSPDTPVTVRLKCVVGGETTGSVNGEYLGSQETKATNFTRLIVCGAYETLITPSKIYSVKIWTDTEQLDLIPCLDDKGKPCMYDKVYGTLKENAGSGAFIAGLATVDDVRKLWLPETGGTLTVSVPADTPDSAVEQLRKNNPSWQIAIQYRTENNEN